LRYVSHYKTSDLLLRTAGCASFSACLGLVAKCLGFEEGLPFTVDDKLSKASLANITVIRRESFADLCREITASLLCVRAISSNNHHMSELRKI